MIYGHALAVSGLWIISQLSVQEPFPEVQSQQTAAC